MNSEIAIQQFNNLSLDEKSYYLWNGATFLHVYEDNSYRINLFHMNNYYIELWYQMEGNHIEQIRAFTSLTLLEPFLDNIQIKIPIN